MTLVLVTGMALASVVGVLLWWIWQQGHALRGAVESTQRAHFVAGAAYQALVDAMVDPEVDQRTANVLSVKVHELRKVVKPTMGKELE